jgi:hypothetical protein
VAAQATLQLPRLSAASRGCGSRAPNMTLLVLVLDADDELDVSFLGIAAKRVFA